MLKCFPGFYGVTYYIGFRDDFDVRVRIIFLFPLLCHFEYGLKLFRPRIWLKKSVSLKDSWILKFRKRFLKKLDQSPKRLHICGSFFRPWNITYPISPPSSTPHYHVVSRRVNAGYGYISPAINYLRAFLIEGLYRRLGRFSSSLVDTCVFFW